MLWMWGIGVVVVLLAIVSVTAIPLAKRWNKRDAQVAVKQFRLQREQLEAKFFDMAKTLGKPRGLRWLDCDWLSAVTFARDRQTKLITAFAGVNIRFEAIEGGDMEDVAAVSTVRDAVAVFHYQNGNWGTGGKALFNMNAEEAVTRLTAQFEAVPGEGSQS
jgi:hypothetical protein